MLFPGSIDSFSCELECYYIKKQRQEINLDAVLL